MRRLGEFLCVLSAVGIFKITVWDGWPYRARRYASFDSTFDRVAAVTLPIVGLGGLLLIAVSWL